MKTKELRQKDKPGLEAVLKDLREQQFRLKMQKALGQLSANHQFKALRRDVAQIKTLLAQGE